MAPRTNNNFRELPEEVVQHIQSFLEYKEAAQTALVAKPWYKAWCTRPILYFIADDFDVTGGFWDYVTKTVQRCIDCKVKVDRLSLLMPFNESDAALVDKLVVDSLKLRVKMFEFYFYDNNDLYVLPAQVFAHEYLTELYLGRCKVDRLVSRNVLCPNLTTLDIKEVSIEDKSFKDIIAGSPIIESLSLSGNLTKGLKRIDARDLHNLKTLLIQDIFSELPGITPSVICGRFFNLISLVLKDVSVDYSFFTNLSSNFPKLEYLSLKRLNYDVNTRRSSLIISSSSIKRLSLTHTFSEELLNMVHCDVPKIKKFKFSGDHVTLVSFTATHGEWESEIKLSRFDEIMIWSELRDLRKQLGQSKISLRFYVYHDRVDTPERSLEDYCLPAVEALMYYNMASQGCYFFIEGVLSLRPKLVHFAYKLDAFVTSPVLVLRDMFIMQKKDGPQTTIYGLSFFYLNNLLEVRVERFEDSLKQWLPLSDALEIQNYEAQQLRLKLEWQSHTSEQTIIKFIAVG